jgi:hypothetical protein
MSFFSQHKIQKGWVIPSLQKLLDLDSNQEPCD